MTGVAVSTAFLAGVAFGWRSALVVAVIGAVWLAIRFHRRQVVVAAMAVALAGLGALRAAPEPEVGVPAWLEDADAVRGQVVTVPVSDGRWQRFVIEVEEVRRADIWAPGTGRLDVTAPLLPTIELGDVVHAAGGIEPIGDLPPSIQAFLRAHRSSGELFTRAPIVRERGTGWRRAVAARRRELGLALSRAAPGDAGALLTGLVTGDDRALSVGRRRAFIRTGTTHVTAVSGANIALVVTVLVTLGSMSGLRRRVVWQALTVGAVWGYALLVGLQPPAVRAALVATGAVLASRFGRRPDYPTLLVLAAAIMAAVAPADLRTLSFRLSFASSLALAVTLPGLRPAGVAGWVGAGFVATAAAQLATVPVLLPTFGTLSFTAIPANLAIAPLVNVAFPLAALTGIVGLVSPTFGDALGMPAHLCADAIFLVVDRLGARTGWTILVGKPPALMTAALIACSALGVGAISGEGRTWARRTWRDIRNAPGSAIALAVGGAGGGVALLGAWLLTR